MKLIGELSKRLKKPIEKPICKLCFKDIPQNTLYSLVSTPSICYDCFLKLKLHLERDKIRNYSFYSLARYEEPISLHLLNFKENKDIELGGIFLSYYTILLKTIFKSFNIVYVPSSYEKEKQRGFCHIKEIYKGLDIPFLDVLKKDSSFEQKKLSREERIKKSTLFRIENGDKVTGKKILLVDDVITTGASILTSIKLLEKYKPKKIVVLVILRDGNKEDYRKLFDNL